MKPKLKRKNYKIAGEILYDDPAGGVAPRIGSGVTNASTTSIPNTINNASSGNMGGMSTGTANAAVAGGTALLNLAAKADSGPHKTAAGQGVATGLKYGAQGASLGAGIGSLVAPGIGTAIGGAAGAMLGFEAGMVGGAMSGYKENKRRRQAEQQDIQNRSAQFAQAQQTTDQTIGTQQSNPVYGMKHGGSLYEMGGNVKKKSFNGIIHSDKNGVDKTEASMPEGTFVVDADHLKQAVKHGVIEPQKVSPHQGGVPIMITGGKVAPEGVISPDKVKQLLAMGVDLDKYAPNADTSIYDLAGTRKNVKNGGRLGYVDAGTIKNQIKFDTNQYIDNIDTDAGKDYQLNVLKDLQEKPQNNWQRVANTDYLEKVFDTNEQQKPVWDPVSKHYFMENTANQNLANLANKNPNDPSLNLDAWSAAGGLNKEPKKYIDPFTVERKQKKEPKTPMTNEEKLRAAQYGILGVEAATQIGEGLWNLSRQRTPVPKPQRFISTPYTPNVSAMDALQQASQNKALATGLYNIRQSGGGAENFNAMHANELENDLSYNAQRTNVTEGARQANTTQENQDRANYANSLYNYAVNEAAATDSFRAAKGQAVTKNIDNLMVLGTQAVDIKKSQVEDQGDKFTTDYSNANYRAHGSGIGTFSASEYRSNKDAINSALDNISLLQSKYPTEYAQYANDVKGMNPIAANAFLISKLNK